MTVFSAICAFLKGLGMIPVPPVSVQDPEGGIVSSGLPVRLVADNGWSAQKLIQYHEGCVLEAIPDTNGFSIGYGHDGAIKGQTCTQAEADAWFAWDFSLATSRAIADLTPAYWDKLDLVRRAVLQDMAYELGGAGLNAFAKMLQAIRAEDWVTGRLEALNSQWAHQVLTRAVMDAEMLLTGQWPEI